ncbi:MAG: FAD-dependent tricarballylate dehydrogenase TcuA [Alphaproteobacteria bacterium]|nr:FAD-dependent tricarballylate dehydrogenase TcuA [Alphaproteobacteria bacterium]
MADFDVIVVGAGNAALASAVSATENGAKVLLLEKAPVEMRGGNTHWSGGVFRFAFDAPRDLEFLLAGIENTYPRFYEGVTPYTYDDFMGDLQRLTGGQTDPELSEILVSNSRDTVQWMHDVGKIPMEPAIGLSGVEKDGVIQFQRGMVVRAEHEGVGLSKSWFATAESMGVEIRYESAAVELLQNTKGRVSGVRVRGPDGVEEVTANAVILAAGGFEANTHMRAQYLGAPWDQAKVRGTPHNQGDGLRMALDIGAMAWGQWSGCHSTPISADWGHFAPRELTDKSNRLSYLYGVLINRLGKRFLDEGLDMQLFTYAKYGRIILNEPGGMAFQIFDQKTVHLLEPRYSTSEPIAADTLPELIDKLDIDDKPQAVKTLEDFNAAAQGPENFDPSQKDGVSTSGLDIEKTNWGLKLDKPPFHAYTVTGGITFTFGGLKIDGQARVMGTDWRPIPGLYTCGEMVGGLFHDNYGAGSGLMSGAVFGRIAGRSAASEKS